MKAIMTLPIRQRTRCRLVSVLLMGLAVGLGGIGYAHADATVSSQTEGGFAAMQSMEPEAMEQTRGRDGVNVHLERVNVQSIQDMDAISANSDFQVINGDMMTGNITFEQGSMGHYSGTGIFNSVTGNANAVNNAIGISVYITQ